MYENQHVKISKKTLVLSFLYIILLLGCIVFFITTHNPKLILSTITPKPEVYTELYFANHTQLPSEIVADTPQTFSFVIHNLEQQTKTYPYTVLLILGDQNETIDTGTITLKSNQSITKEEIYTIATTSATQGKISVLLPKQSQQIDFYIYSQ